MKEKREQAEAERVARKNEKTSAANQAITLNKYFYETYFPQAKELKKHSSSRTEEGLFRLWVAPMIGEKTFAEVYPTDIEKIRKKVITSGKSPRHVEYVFAVIRQLWNLAKRDELTDKETPTAKVKLPKKDNRRVRFLTAEEADLLLTELKKRSPQLHSMALLALYCGLRAGEIFSLQGSDIDFDKGTLLLRDTKNGRNRTAYMPDFIQEHIRQLPEITPNELIFKTSKGTKIKFLSKTFFRVVEDLGLNEGVDDPRNKVVFHSLRHTYASWLVAKGVDLYTVMELMGHSSIVMTERYSHIREEALKEAVNNFSNR